MTNEPVIAGYTISALAAIILNLVVVLDWWQPTADQIAGVTAAVVAVVSIVAAILTRRVVTPVAKALRPPAPPA